MHNVFEEKLFEVEFVLLMPDRHASSKKDERNLCSLSAVTESDAH